MTKANAIACDMQRSRKSDSQPVAHAASVVTTFQVLAQGLLTVHMLVTTMKRMKQMKQMNRKTSNISDKL